MKIKKEGDYVLNDAQLYVLEMRQADVDGAMKRLCGREDIYVICMKAFLEDVTIQQLNSSIEREMWDEAFTAAHALKGVAGNMGFVSLMHAVGQLLVLIRGGRTHEIPNSLEYVNSSYRDIIDGIHKFFALDDNKKEK